MRTQAGPLAPKEYHDKKARKAFSGKFNIYIFKYMFDPPSQ